MAKELMKKYIEILKNKIFLLIALTYLLQVASGSAFLNILGPYVIAMGFKSQEPFVVGVFISNAVMSLLNGFMSDLCLRKIPRPAFLMFTGIMASVGYFLLYQSTTLIFVYIGVCFAGGAFGGIWAVLINTLIEIFGNDTFGFSFCILNLTSLPFTFMFAKISGSEFDANSDANRDCFGRVCFENTLLIMCILEFASIFTALALAWFSRKHYKKLNIETLPLINK